MRENAADRFVVKMALEASSTCAELVAYFDGRAMRARQAASDCFEDAAQAANVVETASKTHGAFARRVEAYKVDRRNAYSDTAVRAAALDARRRFDKGRDYERHADACDRISAALSLGARYEQSVEGALSAAGYYV